MRRFIVLIDEQTKEGDKELSDWCKEKRCASWHWISNSWLIVDPHDELVTSEVRERVQAIFTGRIFVIGIGEDGEDSWSGRGAKDAKGRSMFEWIKDFWNPAKKVK